MRVYQERLRRTNFGQILQDFSSLTDEEKAAGKKVFEDD